MDSYSQLGDPNPKNELSRGTCSRPSPSAWWCQPSTGLQGFQGEGETIPHWPTINAWDSNHPLCVYGVGFTTLGFCWIFGIMFTVGWNWTSLGPEIQWKIPWKIRLSVTHRHILADTPSVPHYTTLMVGWVTIFFWTPCWLQYVTMPTKKSSNLMMIPKIIYLLLVQQISWNMPMNYAHVETFFESPMDLSPNLMLQKPSPMNHCCTMVAA